LSRCDHITRGRGGFCDQFENILPGIKRPLQAVRAAVPVMDRKAADAVVQTRRMNDQINWRPVSTSPCAKNSRLLQTLVRSANCERDHLQSSARIGSITRGMDRRQSCVVKIRHRSSANRAVPAHSSASTFHPRFRGASTSRHRVAIVVGTPRTFPVNPRWIKTPCGGSRGTIVEVRPFDHGTSFPLVE